ncbi:MAG: DUF45 domain-containing protein [Desulfobacterales bacterium]|nr:DUF45 domain-containing protein [Desulfobacterales bacterium]
MTIDLPEIGEVLFEQSSRARRINITVKPFNNVRVAVPRGISFESAEQVARQKAGWIKARQEKTKQMEARHREYMQDAGYISRAAAKGLIIGRLEELARAHGIAYNRVFIRNQKTRWGSCSSGKNLSLNYKIVLLPRELMDYVLLHELAHVRHCNHGRQFWEELNRLVEDAKAMDRKLNEYSALLLPSDF